MLRALSGRVARQAAAKSRILEPCTSSEFVVKHRVEQRRGHLFRMQNPTPGAVKGYYVTLPDVPDETAANNPLLAAVARGDDWPPLASTDPRQFYEAVVRLIMEHAATVWEHLEYLEKQAAAAKSGPSSSSSGDADTTPASWESVVDPIISEEEDALYAFHTLLLRMLTDWPDSTSRVFDEDLHHVKVMCARDTNEKLTSPVFQDAIKALYQRGAEELETRVNAGSVEILGDKPAVQKDEKKSSLSAWQLRLLEWWLLEIRAGGYDVRDERQQKLIGSWGRFIDTYRSKYLTQVHATNDQATFDLSADVLKTATPQALKDLAVDRNNWRTGPWRAKMMPASVHATLAHCRDRGIRQEIWRQWNAKASFDHDHYNNSVVVEEIRHNNEGMAKALGYGSVAEHVLANKMAGSPETVRHFLEAVKRRLHPVFMDRYEAWNQYAARHEMISGGVQPFDLFYLCPREAEHHYDVSFANLAGHYPFWPTMEKVFGLLTHIFNLSFEDVSDQPLERCHPSVRIYAVRDKSFDEHLGRLYIDPFDRPGKAGNWNVLLGRMPSVIRAQDKLVYAIGSAEEGSGMHYLQLQKMLAMVGRSVQLLVSRAPYRDLAIPWAPRRAADWDAADLFPGFLQQFVFKPALLLAMASNHVETNASLDADAANSHALALSRAQLWGTYRTLFWADYDMTLFEMEDRRKRFWLDVYKDMHAAYFPWRLQKGDYAPCSFTPIFGVQPHMAMYYRKLWTEMLALDVHERFDEEADEPRTGERLKETLLAVGAGDVAKHLYRRFQGRDPSVGALCDFYDPPPATEHILQKQQ